MKKKAQTFGLGMIVTIVVIFLIVGLAAIYSLDIMDSTKKDFCDYNYVSSTGACLGCPSATKTKFNATDNYCYNSSDEGRIAATVIQDVSYNATIDVIAGVQKVPAKMPTLGNVAIAAIIIGVLLTAFGGFMAARRLH